MTPEMVAQLISGGGTLALAVLVWMQQRDITTELRALRALVAQQVTYMRVSRESGPVAAPPLPLVDEGM